MNLEIIKDILLDALKDSASVFLFVFIFHALTSFFEGRMASYIASKKTGAPVIGSLFGLIPQCGTSVLGSDLYARGYITAGTLIAIFLSCSDEAMLVLLSGGAARIIPTLLILKFVIGSLVGLAVNAVVKQETSQTLDTYEGHAHSENSIDSHLLHPLHHAFEVFVYVLVINIVMGTLIQLIGEENLSSIISGGKHLTPLLASILGLVPNCASSVILSELYMSGNIAFGALTGGLLVNCGLGILVLFKRKATIKSAIWIIAICFTVSVASGYIICFINGF